MNDLDRSPASAVAAEPAPAVHPDAEARPTADHPDHTEQSRAACADATSHLLRELARHERRHADVTGPVRLRLFAVRRGLLTGSWTPEAYLAELDQLLARLAVETSPEH
ncbi:hypothetical protein [Nocardioides bruguierae]|uniref:Uncharacterized protein n=1 Tax=Nocardioides bruguierae TaxID=2945102 RepID=A0A9X2IH67_9ACTN|nr:hypothetical protein [Nocardioides bruguierae]MCL8026131.1 hypothetical protein [Nocardioides bruguierae]MCM0621475.1 hypothetical protein [Nocardioides bruguierae]